MVAGNGGEGRKDSDENDRNRPSRVLPALSRESLLTDQGKFSVWSCRLDVSGRSETQVDANIGLQSRLRPVGILRASNVLTLTDSVFVLPGPRVPRGGLGRSRPRGPSHLPSAQFPAARWLRFHPQETPVHPGMAWVVFCLEMVHICGKLPLQRGPWTES